MTLTIPVEYVAVLLGSVLLAFAWMFRRAGKMSDALLEMSGEVRALRGRIDDLLNHRDKYDLGKLEERVATNEREIAEVKRGHERLRDTIDDVRRDFTGHPVERR